MEKCISLKFNQHEDLKRMLLRTGQTLLVENTTFDVFWGDGDDGTGLNMLGKLLTELRLKFLQEELHLLQ